jgi:hypothetical protein
MRSASGFPRCVATAAQRRPFRAGRAHATLCAALRPAGAGGGRRVCGGVLPYEETGSACLLRGATGLRETLSVAPTS